MSKFKIINLFDKVFITIAVFLIVYAWLNFFVRNLWTTFVLSLIFTFALIFLLFYFSNKKREKKSNLKKHQKEVEEKFLAFRLLSKKQQLNLLNEIINKETICTKKMNHLVFRKDEKKHQLIVASHVEKLNQFELENLLQNLEKDTEILIVVCNEIFGNLNTKILNNLEIELVMKNELFKNYFSPHNVFPDCTNLKVEKPKIKLVDLMKNFFVPSKAKSYFLCGLVLIFSSIILPFHVYYLIFGSILLLFSIICKLQPLFKR